MSTATISGKIDRDIDGLLKKQVPPQAKKSEVVSRYVTEKTLETAFPGVAFRNGAAGREAYLAGHRVAVWEVARVHEQTRSLKETAAHFGWPVVLVKRALAYAGEFPDEIKRCQTAETE